jgi:hypothetical protein
MKRFWMVVFLAAALFVVPTMASAGSIGVYCWQIAPYVDVVCFDIDSKGFAMAATGWDHANGSYKYAAHGGVCEDNYCNVYSFDWTSMLVNFGADISPGSLNGVWYDFTGDGGDFLFVGAGPQVEGVVEGIGPKFGGR